MINNEEILALRLAIKDRFFEALDALAAKKAFRGREAFARIYGVNTGNFHRIRIGKQTLPLEYMHFLVRDFGVSSRWLLTSEGEMFVQEKSADSVPADA